MDPSKLNVLYLNLRKMSVVRNGEGPAPSLLPTFPDATCLKYKLHICIYKLLQYSKCEFSTYVHMLCLLNRVYSSKVDADSLNMGARLRDYRDFSKRSPDDLHRHSRNQHYRKRQRGSKGHRENTQRLYPNRLLDY